MYSLKTSNTSSSLLRPCLNIAAIGICSIALLSGCQTTNKLFGKVDNGSLEYLQAKQIAPLQLPADQSTAPFVPLFPIPMVGPNTLSLENDSGKRYELPPPYRREVAE